MLEHDQEVFPESRRDWLSPARHGNVACHLSRGDRPVVSARAISRSFVLTEVLKSEAVLCEALSVLYRRGRLGTEGEVGARIQAREDCRDRTAVGQCDVNPVLTSHRMCSRHDDAISPDYPT
jgi:hypothetical protein